METLSQVWRIAQVVFGIGLVIFVHEAGHFIAARMCRVRVEVFSLGFGPRLIGWRRGATLYQIAAVPLGGYVKMAGEEITARGRPDGGAAAHPDGDALYEKSVGQRFFIYSGGVLMNVVFCLVVFPFVLASGVPVVSPIIGPPVKGSPAWRADLQAGSRVLSVNGSEVYDFYHIPNEVALGGANSATFELLVPGDDDPVTVTLQPKYDESTGFFRVGIRNGFDPEARIEVAEGGPAAEAGLASGDQLLGVVGAPVSLTLPEQLRQVAMLDEPVELRVLQAGLERTARIVPRPAEAFGRKLIGVEPAAVHVKEMRENATLRALRLRKDDRVLRINGRPVARNDDLLPALLASQDEIQLEIERRGARLTLEGPAIRPEEAPRLLQDLYLAADMQGTRIAVMPGTAAADAGIQSGDVITAIDGTPVGDWPEFQDLAKQSVDRGGSVQVALQRDESGSLVTFDVEVEPRALVAADFGFGLRRAEQIYRVDGLGPALQAGAVASWRFIEDVWLTLRRIASGEVSGQNVGGIISISVISHDWAAKGWAKLFFFLCMLSMNLAFLNVLPIPVLDGGHLFFLLIEKLKGSPVSERTLGYSQIVGLVLIVSLMVYVTYNDIERWFFAR